MEIPPQLQQVADRLKASPDALEVATPRELAGWFGFSRRTWRQSHTLKAALRTVNLETIPDFEGVGFDNMIEFHVVRPVQTSQEIITLDPNTTTTTPEPIAITSQAAIEPGTTIVDPVQRVSRFLSNSPVISVGRDDSIAVAVTKMMMSDFSQLPVMQGERNVFGIVSWKSIGAARAIGQDPKFVRECTGTCTSIADDASIFSAIRHIQEQDCVLVKNKENKIIGILTAADISVSFEHLSRPFLLLSYVEHHLRALIQRRFAIEELRSAKDPQTDPSRTISDVSDLTFGEYVRLLENPANWAKLGVNLERSLFVTELNKIREIRNDVMHFNPDGIEEKDLQSLQRFSTFLQEIVEQRIS